MKKLLTLAMIVTVLTTVTFGEGLQATPDEVLKITSLIQAGKTNNWYGLAGTQRLTEVQFLEAIGDTEYLEKARLHGVTYMTASAQSTGLFVGSVVAVGLGVGVGIVGGMNRDTPIMIAGTIVALLAGPLYVAGVVVRPNEVNLLGADQAQVLADRFNAAR